MEVLEAIRQRRTVRVPFNGKKPPEEMINTLMDVSAVSPSGDPVSWRLARVEDHETKAKLALVVAEDFGDYFQKNGKRFRQVFSEYPKWLRFSAEARDGIRLAGFPRVARHFYGVALGRRLGPLFGRMGVMNREIRSYCRNVVANPALFGVFLDRNIRSTGVSSIINSGSMLQNLRLAATSIGLSYQDLGWITATKYSSDRARALLNVPDRYAAVNFFRIGYADGLNEQDKISDFRRSLEEIVHVERFGIPFVHGQRIKKTNTEVLEAIRGVVAAGESGYIRDDDIAYVLEAARWAPTGFNVQPFEFIITRRDESAEIVVLENKERRDPDPGPCEALARGGVLQNIRLAARALGLEYRLTMRPVSEGRNIGSRHGAPRNYSVISEIQIRRKACRH